MQPLTTLTLAALALGAAAFAYDSATAQTPASCPTHEVSLYFEKGQTQLNDYSKQVADRIAAEAKACGAREIVAETKVSGKRALAITETFEALGVNVVLVGPHLWLVSAGDTVADRTAKVRITVDSQVG
ncbi:MAG: hypothetical protein Q8R02_06110 [Hyphomonadaceae bacterium]|nr:hypothetical protein [Hyphomonadaceae bacterium]